MARAVAVARLLRGDNHMFWGQPARNRHFIVEFLRLKRASRLGMGSKFKEAAAW